MIAFGLAGGIRNLIGLALLVFFDYLGTPVTLSLLIANVVGFIVYVYQVRLFIGEVHIVNIAKATIVIYILNRFLLWLLHENLGLALYLAQIISIALLTLGSYRYLQSKAAPKTAPADDKG